MTEAVQTPVLEHTGRRALAVHPGDVVAVLGAPGSGKTRLALELALLSRPEEGEVLLRGEVVRMGRLGMTERPQGVTLLVQNAEDQLFARTVFDDVAFGPRHLHLDEEEIEERVLGALRAVRLDEGVRDRSPFALSGGERRRVALAGVLAMQPEVLVLDEPTASLDPRTRNEFRLLLEPLRERSAVIWFTSSAREASLADRVYLLRDGQAEDVGRGDELLDRWRALQAAGVELPALFELAGGLERAGYSLPDGAEGGEMEGAIVRVWQERHAR